MGPDSCRGPFCYPGWSKDQMIRNEAVPPSAERERLLDANIVLFNRCPVAGYLMSNNVVLVVRTVTSLDCEGCSRALPTRT